jgi:hypothetical protein
MVIKHNIHVKVSIPMQSAVITEKRSGVVEKMENLLVTWRIITKVHRSEPNPYSRESSESV